MPTFYATKVSYINTTILLVCCVSNLLGNTAYLQCKSFIATENPLMESVDEQSLSSEIERDLNEVIDNAYSFV